VLWKKAGDKNQSKDLSQNNGGPVIFNSLELHAYFFFLPKW